MTTKYSKFSQGQKEKYLAKRREKYHLRNKEAEKIWRNLPANILKKKIREQGLAYKTLTRKNHLRRKYQITPETYETLFNQQNGVCAICLNPEAGDEKLAVDHAHATKSNRGLLCKKCNMAIGLLRDDPVLLENAKMYLIKHSKKTQ